MPKYNPGDQPLVGTGGERHLGKLYAFEAALRDSRQRAASEAGSLTRSDQFARDIAEIERAAAALREAALAPDSQIRDFADDPPVITMRRPRSVWIVVWLLWLAIAAVIGAALAAIAKLVR